MKLLSIALLLSAALAAVAQGDAGFPDLPERAPLARDQELPSKTNHLRRFLADGSGGGGNTPTTAPPATSKPPTPAPPTSAPPTPAPPTTSPPTSAPPSSPSPGPNTPAPPSPSPNQPTPAPSPSPNGDNGGNNNNGNNGNTPAPTPAPSPTSNNNNNGNNNGNNGNTTIEPAATVSPNKDDDGSTGTNSASKSTKTPAPSTPTSGSDTSSDSDSSKMSGGTIAGIAGAIVAGVAILACITMVLIRRKREQDDDPLSPFEMSMDKGYAGVAAQQQQHNAYGSGPAPNGHGAQRNAPSRQHELIGTDTPPAGAIAAGVAYSQFYDQQTSPTSAQQQQHLRQLSGDDAAGANDPSNLWMSAMEVQDGENDSYLSAKEAHPDNESLTSSNRNSYDLGSNHMDMDQSSQISGASDLNSAKDFPDYEDESARGSYEL